MDIRPFQIERYFARHEFRTPFLLCCSDCESISVGELLALEPGAMEDFHRLWLGYTESTGHPVLRQHIAALYDTVADDEVLVHAGAEEAIFNLMQVLLNRGDHVVVHYPCYQSLMEVAAAIGCQVTPWPADENDRWALDPEFLTRHLRSNTKLVVVNCPHNPTGHVMPRDDYHHLAQLSQKHGFVLFSDEVYRGLEYDPADRLPAACDVTDTGVSLGVMSKSLGLAGLRIGWIATHNRRLYEAMAAFKDYTTICNSAPSEYLSIVALKHQDVLLQRNLAIIKANLTILNGFFDRYRDRFDWQCPPAGPIGYPLLRDGDIDRFCDALVAKAGVLLLPGTAFEEGSNRFRIGFGRRNMPEAVNRLDDFLQRHRI